MVLPAFSTKLILLSKLYPQTYMQTERKNFLRKTKGAQEVGARLTIAYVARMIVMHATMCKV